MCLTRLTYATCVMQMLHGVEQQQAVAELEARGENVHQKGDATDDPAPAAVRIEVLRSKCSQSGVIRFDRQLEL